MYGFEVNSTFKVPGPSSSLYQLYIYTMAQKVVKKEKDGLKKFVKKENDESLSLKHLIKSKNLIQINEIGIAR